MLEYSLKSFNKMKITFHVIDDEESFSLTLPLEGFSEALDYVEKHLDSF